MQSRDRFATQEHLIGVLGLVSCLELELSDCLNFQVKIKFWEFERSFSYVF